MYRIARAAMVCGVLLIHGSASAVRAQESWDAIYMKDDTKGSMTKIGFMHVQLENLKHKGQDLVRVRVDWDMNFLRGKSRVHLTQMYGTIETREGTILRIDNRIKASEQDIRTYGDYDKASGKMNLTLEVGGQKRLESLPWSDDIRGPYASELSLSRKPIAAGEAREVRTFVPDLNKVCLTKLTAKSFESIPLGPKREPRDLMRVEQVVTDEKGTPLPGMASTLWVDASGQILRTFTDLYGGMETIRTTKVGAMGGAQGDIDLNNESIVKTREIPDSDRTKAVVYRLRMDQGDLSEIFPTDRRQATKATKVKGEATIEVKRAGPNQGEADANPPAAEFLRPNPLINSDDSLVQQHAKTALRDENVGDDPWAKASAIEKWVFNNIKKKTFNIAFASAAEVARNLEGDCTEHGVLFAAMCRAQGIPSRCVVGLVYDKGIGGFGFHMWNEVYVNNRWVAVDSTFGQTDVDATHLMLSKTSLDGAAPFETFLPVMKVVKKLKIEPVEIR